MNVLRENWGFIAIGVAGGACWAMIGFVMHLVSKQPVCPGCSEAGGAYRAIRHAPPLCPSSTGKKP